MRIPDTNSPPPPDTNRAPDYINSPRAYDLEDPREVRRLIREVNGYLRTCIMEHHGTDRAGRAFAADAMRALMERDPQIIFTR